MTRAQCLKILAFKHMRSPNARPTHPPERPGDQRPGGFPSLTCGALALNAAAWCEIRRGLKLSAREVQIVQGIFDDKLEDAIADELGISRNTLRTQLRRLRRKLRTANRVMLVLRVVEEFLRQTACDEATLPPICRNRAAGRCPLQRAEPG